MKREEEIKQNAEAFATENYGEYDEHDYTDHSGRNLCYAVSKKAFIAGAHSRDEEIKQLCNPWRDAKTELPKEKCKVYVLKNGVPDFAIYTGRKKNKTFVTAYLVRHLVGTYLDISENGIEFKKDVSALFRKDITNEITHWMPIPELLKED